MTHFGNGDSNSQHEIKKALSAHDTEPAPVLPDNGSLLTQAHGHLTNALELLDELSLRHSFQHVQNQRE